MELIVISGLILFILNWLLFAPSTSHWSVWFAWYPVKVQNKTIWLKLVKRRKFFTGSSSATDNDYIVYQL